MAAKRTTKKAKTAATKKKATKKKATKKKATKKTPSKAARESSPKSKKAASKASPKKTTKKAAKKAKAAPPVAAAPEPKKPKAKISPAMKRKLRSFREMLLTKKEALSRHLQSELSGLEAADKHHLADLEEMASDTQDTDSVCEIMEISASTLEQIDKALTRIDDGSYGLCEDCGDSIPVVRLEALPFATLCISCKRKEELAQRY